jgi:hypothetical protein
MRFRLSGGWLVASAFDSQASFVKYWAVGISALGSNAHAGDELQEWALRR